MPTVAELKDSLTELGLSTKGKKAELQERLDKALQKAAPPPIRRMPGHRDPDRPNYNYAGQWIGPPKG